MQNEAAVRASLRARKGPFLGVECLSPTLWRATIVDGAESHNLGTYATAADAALAYDCAAREILGEAAVLNFPTVRLAPAGRVIIRRLPVAEMV